MKTQRFPDEQGCFLRFENKVNYKRFGGFCIFKKMLFGWGDGGGFVVSGLWSLVTGASPLVPGPWFLAPGSWSLVPAPFVHGP